jgi:DNA-binding transcriptional regulator/RsmH inhibitor MraZ
VNSSFELERFLRWHLEESSNSPEAVVNSSAGGAQPKRQKVFVGQKRIAIDSGGRIRLPSDFCEELGDNPVMRCIGPGRLVLMSSLDYLIDLELFDNRYPKEILNSEFKYSVEYSDNFVADVGNCFECPIDGNGRIRIPKDRRESAQINGDHVIITASKSKVYIYTEEAWRQVQSKRKEKEESENR